MKTLTLALTSAALALSTTATAQSAQDKLDERYNRALAAGYKALFLCGALANSERNGTNRLENSVKAWELTGVYSKIDPIVRTLEHRVIRAENRMISHVEVDWADDMPPRFAKASFENGCRLAPIGVEPGPPQSDAPFEKDKLKSWPTSPDGGPMFPPQLSTFTDRSPYLTQMEAALDGTYGEGTRTTAVVIAQGENAYSRYVDPVKIDRENRANSVGGYTRNTPQRTWSVAKSIAATLVGVAVHKGQIDVNEPGVREEWANDARKDITVDHLLRMASGRYSDTPGNRTDPLYAGGSTVEETATNWPLIHKPGTKYRYANNDTLMAIKAITDRTDDFDPQAFFKTVGMFGAVAETDWSGDFILSSQVWATANDLVALGRLHLRDGVLEDDTRILPEGWTKYVSTPSGPQPEGRGWGYGAGWWLFNNHQGIPKDTFLAAGNRGQFLVIVPSMDLVIVRRGEDMVGTRFDIEAFTRDVISAINTADD